MYRIESITMKIYTETEMRDPLVWDPENEIMVDA